MTNVIDQATNIRVCKNNRLNHMLREKLMADVLEAIAEGYPHAAQMAAEALQAENVRS